MVFKLDFDALNKSLLSPEEELLKIQNNLDGIGVPGEGVSWKRIVEYAETYHLRFTDLSVSLEDEPRESGITLSEDQEKAWAKIQTWASNEKPYFVLKGVSGAGKSLLTAKLSALKKKVYFTAPTNKAAKVLGNFVGTKAKTTYSQLGLRMNEDDESLVMDYNNPSVYMPKNSILVVDECSMVSTALFDCLKASQNQYKFKIFFVGDPGQLNPISEKTSPVWRVTGDKDCKAALKKVMRFDNQILNLSTRIRQQMIDKNYAYPIEDDHDKKGGVYVLDSFDDFVAQIKLPEPKDYVDNKVVCWRNKAVTHYNNIIRSHLGFDLPYCKDEIVLIAKPVSEDGRIVANIDDEFTIISVLETEMKAEDIYIPVYRLGLRADTSITVNIPVDSGPLDTLLTQLAGRAKRAKGLDRKIAWKKFWDVRNKFHDVRYGYAITSHRVQGTTLESVFVDSQDILANRNKREAWRSLYVAVTRATTKMYTF